MNVFAATGCFGQCASELWRVYGNTWGFCASGELAVFAEGFGSDSPGFCGNPREIDSKRRSRRFLRAILRLLDDGRKSFGEF